MGEKSLTQRLLGAGVWGVVGRKVKAPRRGVEPRDLRAPGAKAELRGQSPDRGPKQLGHRWHGGLRAEQEAHGWVEASSERQSSGAAG